MQLSTYLTDLLKQSHLAYTSNLEMYVLNEIFGPCLIVKSTQCFYYSCDHMNVTDSFSLVTSMSSDSDETLHNETKQTTCFTYSDPSDSSTSFLCLLYLLSSLNGCFLLSFIFVGLLLSLISELLFNYAQNFSYYLLSLSNELDRTLWSWIMLQFVHIFLGKLHVLAAGFEKFMTFVHVLPGSLISYISEITQSIKYTDITCCTDTISVCTDTISVCSDHSVDYNAARLQKVSEPLAYHSESTQISNDDAKASGYETDTLPDVTTQPLNYQYSNLKKENVDSVEERKHKDADNAVLIIPNLTSCKFLSSTGDMPICTSNSTGKQHKNHVQLAHSTTDKQKAEYHW